MTRGSAASHPVHEDFAWTIAVADHPRRRDSAAYRASRALLMALASTVPEWAFAPGPFEDHHGGGLWVKDDKGWLCVALPLGIEWSAQFCADPVKVDRLRQESARVVAAFPATLPGYAAAGYRVGEQLLTTPITTPQQVAAWTDSIFNASLPLPHSTHSGVLPAGAGYHHYPKPIVDIDHFRYDDFDLFVTDPQGYPAVVVPVGRRGSGDGRVRLLGVHPGSTYAERLTAAPPRPDPRRPGGTVKRMRGGAGLLAADDPLARQAFAHQS